MSGIVRRASVGAGNDFLSVVGKDEVGKDVTLCFSNTGPGTTLFTALGRIDSVGLIEDGFPPMKFEKRGDIAFDASSRFNGSDTVKGIGSHVVEKKDDIRKAKEPKGGRGAGTIHDTAADAFDIPNLAFGKVLVLVLRFALEVLDLVKAKDVTNASADLDLCIVGEEAVGGTVFPDEVLKGSGHFSFAFHTVGNKFGTAFAHVDLSHSATSMTHDSVDMSRGVREEGIGSDIFIPSINVGSRPASVVVFAEGITRGSTGKLRSGKEGLLNAFEGQPSEIGTKEFEIGSSFGNGTLVDTVVQKTGQSVIVATGLMVSAALIDDEIDIVIDVASVVAMVIDTWIPVTVGERCIEDEISDREFIINTGRIPNIVTSKDDMRKVMHFKVRRRAHVHVG